MIKERTIENPMLLINISYLLEYNREMSALFMLNIYNCQLFQKEIKFVQSVYETNLKIKKIEKMSSKKILKTISYLLKNELKDFSEKGTVGDVFFENWLINWKEIKKHNISKKVQTSRINKINIQRIRNLQEIGKRNLDFLEKYLIFENKNEEEKFFNKIDEKTHENENRNIRKNVIFSFRDLPILLYKLGTYEACIDCLRICPIFYEAIEKLVNNYATFTIPNLDKFHEKEVYELQNFLENFKFFDRIFYEVFRTNLYLKHEYYDFDIENIMNDFLELRDSCCIKKEDNAHEQMNIKKINSQNIESRFLEYKKLFLNEKSDNKESSFSDEEFLIEEDEELEKENISYKIDKNLYTDTDMLRLPFCLCGYLHNFYAALKYKFNEKHVINYRCAHYFKLLRSPFYAIDVVNILRKRRDHKKIAIFYADVLLLKEAITKKFFLNKRKKNIEIHTSVHSKTAIFCDFLLLYITVTNKLMCSNYIYKRDSSKSKPSENINNFKTLLSFINRSLNCFLNLAKYANFDFISIFSIAFKYPFFSKSMILTNLLKDLKRSDELEIYERIKISKKFKGTLIEKITGQRPHNLQNTSVNFLLIIYEIYGDKKILKFIQKIRAQEEILMRKHFIGFNSEKSLKNLSDENWYHKKNREINLYRPFSNFLHDLNDKEKIKCIDHFVNYNLKEKQGINYAKMLIKLGKIEEAKKVLSQFKTKKAINILNGINKEKNILFLKKQVEESEEESLDKTFSLDEVSVLLEK